MSQGLIWSVLVLVDSFVQGVEFKVTENYPSQSKRNQNSEKNLLCNQSATIYIFVYLFIF